MRYIINNSNNPYFNLAFEEYCLMNIDVNEDYYILWQNEPSIIVGKNQNTIEEINPRFVEEKNINVARRISGGGAVYHDLGNLNFTFIGKFEDLSKVSFEKYARPIIEALSTLGIEAQLSGRNDITIDNKKISGNAQKLVRNRLMQHGTLLYDVNINDLVEALNVKMDKITSKGIKSVRSRVTNIKEHLNTDMDVNEFKELIHRFLSDNYKSEEIVLSDEDIDNIKKLSKEKFGTWKWNYGESPEFNIKNERRFPGGKVEVLINIKEGVIENCKIYGDYLGVLNVSEVEDKLNGLKYEISVIRDFFESIDIQSYFGAISLDELLDAFFG